MQRFGDLIIINKVISKNLNDTIKFPFKTGSILYLFCNLAVQLVLVSDF